ncbi:MAG: hypothetical protein EBR28_01830 [Planctomycetia bacterium]|nr:hypothetical protein [Planctomycetia bacterium]
MTAYRDEYDDDDGEDDWDEDGDDEPTVPCPYCRAEMIEDAPQCPACGRYVSAEDHPGPRQPLWIIATAVVCLAMAIGWVLAGL